MHAYVALWNWGKTNEEWMMKRQNWCCTISSMRPLEKLQQFNRLRVSFWFYYCLFFSNRSSFEFFFCCWVHTFVFSFVQQRRRMCSINGFTLKHTVNVSSTYCHSECVVLTIHAVSCLHFSLISRNVLFGLLYCCDFTKSTHFSSVKIQMKREDANRRA